MRYGKWLLVVALGVCAMSGSSALGAGVFQESGGLVVVEVESAPVASPWVSETSISGYTGSAYYRTTTNAWDPGSGELVYTINITNAGTYRLCIRGHKLDVGDIGAHNDSFVKMVGQPGAEGTYNKVYLPGTAGIWSWDTIYDVSGSSYIPEYELSAGQHEFRICARSQHYSIDRFVLFRADMINASAACDTSNPQSSTTPIANGTIQFASSTYSGPETGSITVTVTRTGGNDGSVSVNYQTQNLTATSGTDYSARNGTLTWADNISASQTVMIPLINDNSLEGPEDFRVTLSSPTGGAGLGSRSQATLTIIDDESAGVLSFASSAITVGEQGGSVTITVKRTGDSDGATTVRYDTSNGSAVAGSDYTARVDGSLSWSDGDAANKTFTVSITDNTTLEDNEAFTVKLSSPTNSAILGSPRKITITITDDDSPGGVSFVTNTYSVNENAGTVTLQATRTGGQRGVATVHWATDPDSATSPADFAAGSGDIQWNNNQSGPRNIVVTITNDGVLEIDEEFTVTLSSVTTASLSSPKVATVKIMDDENDSEVPTLTLTAPTNGDDVGGVVLVTGNASDNLAVGSVKISVDGGAYVTAPGIPLAGSVDWIFELPTWSLPNGDHDITVLVTDYRGLPAATQTVTVTVSNDIGILGANGMGGCVPGSGAGAGAGTFLMAFAFLVGSLRRKR